MREKFIKNPVKASSLEKPECLTGNHISHTQKQNSQNNIVKNDLLTKVPESVLSISHQPTDS